MFIRMFSTRACVSFVVFAIFAHDLSSLALAQEETLVPGLKRVAANKLPNQQCCQKMGLLIPLYIYPANIHTNTDYNRIMNLKRDYTSNVDVCPGSLRSCCNQNVSTLLTMDLCDPRYLQSERLETSKPLGRAVDSSRIHVQNTGRMNQSANVRTAIRTCDVAEFVRIRWNLQT